MVYRTILDALGNTPLIELNHMTTPDQARIVVKYEGLNVGGSIKTRTALQMIEGAETRGIIGPDSIIVEPTSGNQGIGLALVCAVKGYKAVLIMPDSVSHERHELVRQYGAEVIMVHDEGDIGECIARCIALADELAENDPRSTSLSSSRTPIISLRTKQVRRKRSCAISIRRSMDSALDSARAEPSRGWDAFYARPIPICRSGSPNQSMLLFFQAAK